MTQTLAKANKRVRAYVYVRQQDHLHGFPTRSLFHSIWFGLKVEMKWCCFILLFILHEMALTTDISFYFFVVGWTEKWLWVMNIVFHRKCEGIGDVRWQSIQAISTKGIVQQNTIQESWLNRWWRIGWQTTKPWSRKRFERLQRSMRIVTR